MEFKILIALALVASASAANNQLLSTCPKIDGFCAWDTCANWDSGW
jgi:hypothetical protein